MTSWNAESDRQLFLAIIAGSDMATPKWDNIKMAGRTKESMRQRFQKLRKMSIEEDTSATGLDDGRTDAPITPAPKRGRGRPAKKRKVEDSEQDSEEEKPAQAKRGRKPKTTIKNEDDEDGAVETELAKAKPVRVTRSKKTDAIVKEEVKEEESEDGAEEDAAITGADADSSETITAGADDLMA